MTIQTLTLGSYQVGCYIVWEESQKNCVLIDPGYEPERILAEAARLGLTVQAILLTHGHFDHVGAVETIALETDCPVWMHRGDHILNPMVRMLFPLSGAKNLDLRFCKEGDTLHLAGLDFQVLETPGHTQGSVCFLAGDALFSGDTLFAGSMGRTDLPGGSGRRMTESLARLAGLAWNGTVYPGHGPATTLEYERKTNPYLK